MAKKKKFYAVKCGRETGIFTDWDVCEWLISGYLGAYFKAFHTQIEAEAFLADKNIILSDDIKSRLAEGRVVAFVDGSFNSETSESA